MLSYDTLFIIFLTKNSVFMTKFIFITGGVLSGIGKGLSAASIGTLLENMGHKISFLKLDPYLNVDPGTMSPHEHGEVFVTEDGAETDLDLGHYERFTNVKLKDHNSVAAGKLYARLIERERRGDFLGHNIQTIPHLTDEIKQTINNASENNSGRVDFLIVEIGGTVGDIEILPFIEAIRQMGLHQGRKDCLYIHLTYVPFLESSGDLKTKPTQHSVRHLCSLGIQPDILICRSKYKLSQDIKKKISLFTNVEEASIISAPDLGIIYELPLVFAQEKLPETIVRNFNITYKEPNLDSWQNIVDTLKNLKQEVNIAIVGKYIEFKDAYKSLYEALTHAQIPTKSKIKLTLIDSQDLTEDNINLKLEKVDGIIVPGGFGDRGIEGKIFAARYARENKIPYLGICLGMQVAAIEFARNVLNMKTANSTEFCESTEYPVIDFMEEQKNITNKGGTMRLGAQICGLKQDSKAFNIYENNKISERHRHRFELNLKFKNEFEKNGFMISGSHETNNLPEIIELTDHKFFIGCQFHPELQSKPFAPHKLFVNFVQAALKEKI